MKIAVITVFNSHNYGSFLQARALGEALRSYGDVTFYNSKTRNNFKIFIGKAKRTIKFREKLSDILKGPFYEFKEWLQIRKCWKSLSSSTEIGHSDVVALGSDEIWNITRAVCRFPVYWGGGIDAFCFSYAPSVNQSTVEDFAAYPEYIDYLRQIDRLSVRDTHSQKVITELAQRKAQIVLDPTLLQKPKEETFRFDRPYIAVYVFEGSLGKEDQNRIIRFAREKGMPLISAGQFLNWCDHCVHSRDGNPFFIFKDAAYVITNTFHGTAYAINYEAQFISFGKAKPKIKSMLAQFGMEDRIVDKNATINEIADKTIDYSVINDRLHTLREQSLAYIESAIDEYQHTKE